jgi:hypothetical protein
MAFDYDAFEWIGDDPRDNLPEFPLEDGAGRPWEEVRPEFLALIDKVFPR